MDRTTQVSLIRRTLDHIEEGVTDLARAEVSYPVSDYYDEARHELEMEAVFREGGAHIVAHASQLERPGDFVSDTICGIPFVVNRAPSGRINAFVNVCRHRGAMLVTEPVGRKRLNFVCPYHAWTYDADGRLTEVPDREHSFPDLDCTTRGLVRLPVEARHGFVWLRLRPEPATPEPVAEYLGPLDAELSGYAFEQHAHYRSEEETRAFNWKVGMESFLENYHFAVLHNKSTHPIFVHNVITIDALGRHIRAVAPKRSIAKLGQVQDADWDIRPNATILYAIFPNACLFVEKSHASLLRFLPLAPDRCRVTVSHIVRDDRLGLRSFWEDNIRLFRAAADEDLAICESMQAGFRSGANREVVFGRNEKGCDLFRRAVARTVAESRRMSDAP